MPLSTFFHPHKPTHSFLLLISRETIWAKGRKRWLWSGVIFFSDWAAILMSLKEFLHCTQHVDSDSWSSELTYDARKTFFKAFSLHYFELCCQETQLHRCAFKLMLEWVQMCDELLRPFSEREGPLSYWTYFLCFIAVISKQYLGRIFQCYSSPPCCCIA